MPDLKTIEKLADNTGYFRFKKLGEEYLLTNEVGQYIFLNENEFNCFISGQTNEKDEKYQELKDKLFIKDKDYQEKMAAKYEQRFDFLRFGPSLHIVVVTLRCNHRCIYCHASAADCQDKSLDMDLATAKKVVDTIFQTTNDAVCIEFQGGEPLLNWETVKFIINYALEKNKLEKKNLIFRLVTNLSLMDEDKMNFLLENGVNFSTSLDGDEKTHNFNRIYLDGNSYKNVINWTKRINQAYQEKYQDQRKNFYSVGALITVTKQTFARYKEVIDTYIEQGYKKIYLRYLNPYGFALTAKEKIWYTPDEYIEFYKKTFDYILEKNYQGTLFYENMAVDYLRKILLQEEPHNLDMRSPCGAGIGQLAYNYNGDVYSCDEGRMISRMGDEMFKLGNINENTFSELINNDLCKAMCTASCTNGLPGHSDHVYQPYWGTCVVYNYSLSKNIFPAMKLNFKWLIDEQILDYIFEKLKNKKNEDIFREWCKAARPRKKSE